MERIGVALELPAGVLKFRCLDDFHPDHLLRSSALSEADTDDRPALLRAILADPDFQALEAAWRSVLFFFRYVATGARLHVHLIDVRHAELMNRLPELTTILTGCDPRWSLLIGLFTFTHDEGDCRLLSHLGALARIAGAPFLASMHSRLFGCESIADAPDPEAWEAPAAEELESWQKLRESEDASWIGLAFPRFLLRLPYGRLTEPVQSFEFEEMPNGPAHNAYLWGNPAMACACLLGQEFNRQGWEMWTRSKARIEGIPLHAPPDCAPTPPAEIWMSEAHAGKIAEEGVMPLASVKDADAIVLVRFQSIADPAQPLAGPW
jgi:type VI secretion system protein ImpC